jgi:RimJ/RimL family protein N-acetyltransferase
MGCARVQLDTTTRQEPARRLFEKLGFSEYDRKRVQHLEVVFYERAVGCS